MNLRKMTGENKDYPKLQWNKKNRIKLLLVMYAINWCVETLREIEVEANMVAVLREYLECTLFEFKLFKMHIILNIFFSYQ